MRPGTKANGTHLHEGCSQALAVNEEINFSVSIDNSETLIVTTVSSLSMMPLSLPSMAMMSSLLLSVFSTFKFEKENKKADEFQIEYLSLSSVL